VLTDLLEVLDQAYKWCYRFYYISTTKIGLMLYPVMA
jgi:hypothetical protein